MFEPTKKDWKLYKEKLAVWQENYMERLLGQYSEYLSKDLPASTKFWELEERIRRDKRTPGVIVDVRRSTMIWVLTDLIRERVINFDDLEEFSDEVKEVVRMVLGGNLAWQGEQ